MANKKTLTPAELKKLEKELEQSLKEHKALLEGLKKCDPKGDIGKGEKITKLLVDD